MSYHNSVKSNSAFLLKCPPQLPGFRKRNREEPAEVGFLDVERGPYAHGRLDAAFKRRMLVHQVLDHELYLPERSSGNAIVQLQAPSHVTSSERGRAVQSISPKSI